MKSPEVRSIYNKLSNFEVKLNRLKGRSSSYPIHKKLDLPGGQDIYDWIAEHIYNTKDINILDAGCGVGHGLLQLVKRLDAKGLGISLSDREITLARKNAVDLNLVDKCSFEVRSYNQTMRSKFDIIIAVESLKHSLNASKSVLNLLQFLKPSGKIFIVDDFFIHTQISDKYIHAYLKEWAVPKLYTTNDYLNMVPKNCSIKIHKLNEFVPVKNIIARQIGYKIASVAETLLRPFSKTNISGIYKAGLALDILYLKGLVTYNILEITKI